MTESRIALTIVTGAVLAALWAGPAAAAEIAGMWRTDDGEAIVDIHPCGTARCGRVVWLKEPTDDAGRPLADENNPDVSLRTRPVCGIDVITGLEAQPDGGWGGGRIYDPDDGKSYSAQARVSAPDTLEVTAYLGTPAFGRGLSWARVAKLPGGCHAPAKPLR